VLPLLLETIDARADWEDMFTCCLIALRTETISMVITTPPSLPQPTLPAEADKRFF